MDIVQARELLLLAARDLGGKSARLITLGDERHKSYCVVLCQHNWHCWSFRDYERWWEAHMQAGAA